MAKPSQIEIEQLIEYTRSKNPELVGQDINLVINASICHLLLKVAPYRYSNETSKESLCLYGTVPCKYRENRYNIPIDIWLEEDHPNVSPLVYVRPTSNMYISRTSKDVLPDGTLVIPYLKEWRHPQSDLMSLLNAMSEAFSRTPPAFAKSVVTNSATSHPTTSSFSNPNASSSVYNASAIKSNASLPLSNASTSNTFLSTIQSAASNQASNVVHSNNPTHRFSDMAAEPQRMLLPIQGFEKMPLVSLEDSVIPLVSLVPDIEQMVWIAKQNCTSPKDGLSPDESASIMLYTMEWEPYEKSFYVIINAALRAANREELKQWFSYLRLVISAYQKLPSTPHIVYRGVKLDLTDQYRRGDTIVWWGFSSCTASIETLNQERFLGKSGTRTLFNIECESGKNIRSHSYYGEEEEVLLLPGRQFQVIGRLDQGNGLQVVQLKEIKPKFPLIKLPS